MDDQNPYASPRYDQAPEQADDGGPRVEVVNEDTQWRFQNFLLVRREATLPARCVKCGATENLIIRRQRVSWCSPWVLLALLCHFFLFLVLALALSRRGAIYIALCERHERRRRIMLRTAWGLAIVGFAAIAYFATLSASAQRNDWAPFVLLFAVLSILAGLLVGIWGARTLQVKYIDKNVIWLKKLPEAFYAHLPQLRSADGRNPIFPWSR